MAAAAGVDDVAAVESVDREDEDLLRADFFAASVAADGFLPGFLPGRPGVDVDLEAAAVDWDFRCTFSLPGSRPEIEE